MPEAMRTAPVRARAPRCSSKKSSEVSQANTGSSERMTAVCVGGRCFCAQLWMVNAAAVAMMLVTARAMMRRGVKVA
jgi:hypothetical protein